MGRGILYGTLGNGGTAYFAAKSDLSTLLEDLALVRPTELNFVPRIWDMLFQEFQSEVDRRSVDGADRAALEAEVMAELRQNLLGGRFVSAMTGSAPISAEMKALVESFLDLHLIERLRLDRGRDRLRRRPGATPAGDRLQAGRRARSGLLPHRPAAPARRAAGQDRQTCSPATTSGRRSPPRCSTPTATTAPATSWPRSVPISSSISTAATTCSSSRRASSSPSRSWRRCSATARWSARSTSTATAHAPTCWRSSCPPRMRCRAAAAMSTSLKPLISESLQDVAKAAGLQSYEIPRDFIIETTPFTLENGLLTGIRKLARPKLKEHYGDRLEQLYAELADSQANELRALRHSGADRPVLETVSRAAGALLGASAADLAPDAHFTDLGGDSLSALTFANLLREIFDIDVPVGVIVSPATDLQALADYIEAERTPGRSGRPSPRCTAATPPRCTPVTSRWTSSSTPRRWPPRRRCRARAPRCAPSC